MTFVVATEKLITETFEGRDQRDKFAVDIKVRGLRLKPRLEARMMMIYVQRNPRACTLAHMQLHTYTPSELATGESTPPRVRLNDLVASLEPRPGDPVTTPVGRVPGAAELSAESHS